MRAAVAEVAPVEREAANVERPGGKPVVGLKVPADVGGRVVLHPWFVMVVDPSFEGMRPLPRQRPILSHFKQYIEGNVVHALDLKCWTPEQAAENEGDQSFHPHQQDDFVGIHVRRPSEE